MQEVRTQLYKSKEEFLKKIETRFDSFFSPDEIENRILTKLWHDLENMRCKFSCPWCGMPCCGIQNCNDMYKPNELPSPDKAKQMHSCQFHRDPSINGTTELINDKETERLPNNGGCPERKARDTRVRITNPADKNGPKIYVDYSYYDTTWTIKTPEEDAEQLSGVFWQWFLAFVSFYYNLLSNII